MLYRRTSVSRAGAPIVLCLLAAGLVAAVAAAAPPPAAAAEADRCVSDCDCPPGQLCQPPEGRCEAVFCPQIFKPVCGLDGKTYGNACEAHAAHVVIAHEGECGKVCGGIAGKPCPEGQFCELPAGECRGRDLQGLCVPKPEICTTEYDPVCGCDEVTYSNDCFRRMAGAQKDHDGPCKVPLEQVSCRSNANCGRGEFCHFRPGVCGSADGVCAPRPEVCPEIFDPVCGCDGVTYSNACFAAAAGQSVRCDETCSSCLGRSG